MMSSSDSSSSNRPPILPLLSGAVAALATYKLVNFSNGARKIPGAHYPTLPPTKTFGQKLENFFLDHLAVEARDEEVGETNASIIRWSKDRVNDGLGVTATRMMGANRVLVVNPKDVEYILTSSNSQQLFPKPGVYRTMSRLLGDGLFTLVDEDVYPVHRAECARAFSPSSLKRIADDCVSAHVGHFLKELDRYSNSNNKDNNSHKAPMDKLLLDLGLKVTAQASFRTEDPEVIEKIHKLYVYVMENLWDPLRFVPVGDKYLLRQQNKNILKGRKELDTIANDVLKQLDSLPAPAEGQGKALIDYLANSSKMTKEVIRDNMITFLFAGFDTTASQMFFVLYWLSKHPQIQEKLHEELAQTFSFGTHPRLDDLKTCEYLVKVCKEAMRLSGVAGSVAKEPQQDVVLPGSKQFIPKGTFMQIEFAAQNVSEQVYGPDADQFRPERWDEPSLEKAGTAGNGVFTPFSIGKRACPGKDFALNEMHLVIAAAVRNYRFSWPEDEKEPFIVEEPVIHPKHTVHLNVEKRTE